ncbi:MAG TPA: hypothetical protein VI451_03980, partial [Anaerolineales bacterium]|nr:hypothetical protein [Anaerolineales bacterium]
MYTPLTPQNLALTTANPKEPEFLRRVGYRSAPENAVRAVKVSIKIFGSFVFSWKCVFIQRLQFLSLIFQPAKCVQTEVNPGESLL